jgi:hypothetical protein
MRKIDSRMLAKFPEARELLKKAREYIKEGDCKDAERLAESIAELGFPVLSADIYKEAGNVRKAREIAATEAEEHCRNGECVMAAGLYKSFGMIEECDLALRKHCVQYLLMKERRN